VATDLEYGDAVLCCSPISIYTTQALLSTVTNQPRIDHQRLGAAPQSLKNRQRSLGSVCVMKLLTHYTSDTGVFLPVYNTEAFR
jgi:hypothetical protein